MAIQKGTEFGTEYVQFDIRDHHGDVACRVSLAPKYLFGARISIDVVHSNGTLRNKRAIPAENIDELIRCLEWAKKRLTQMAEPPAPQAHNGE